MFASLALVLAVLPPVGTYSYSLDRDGSSFMTSKVAIAHTPDGLTVSEQAQISGQTIVTVRHFDRSMRELDYVAQTPKGELRVVLSRGKATTTYQGSSQDFQIASTMPVIVGDNLLAPATILPALTEATHATSLTFFAVNGSRAITVTIDSSAHPERPSDVPAGDVALSISLLGLSQTIWYDPKSGVVNDLESGGGVRARLTDQNGTADTFAAPSTPAPLRSSYGSRDVTFTSKDGSSIAGTISYPASQTRVAGVVLVGGSGTHDRNEAIGGLHPFWDIAKGLNANGFAVLRYDKRFSGGSTSKTPPAGVTRQSYIDDAMAAIVTLRADPRVDSRRIYLLGHSEGGELVMGAQLEGAGVSGLMLLAPLPEPYSTILEDQVKRGMGSQAEVDQLVAANATFMQSWSGIDPRQEIAKIDVPLLIVHGTKDINVTGGELAPLEDAAKAAHRALTVVNLDGDDHMYSTATAAFDPRVIQTLAAWLSAAP